MNKLVYFSLAIFLLTGLTLAAPKGAKQKTFLGNISDSMCGRKHMMPGGDKECTLKCVSGGSKFVLADTAHKKVYQLGDQEGEVSANADPTVYWPCSRHGGFSHRCITAGSPACDERKNRDT